MKKPKINKDGTIKAYKIVFRDINNKCIEMMQKDLAKNRNYSNKVGIIVPDRDVETNTLTLYCRDLNSRDAFFDSFQEQNIDVSTSNRMFRVDIRRFVGRSMKKLLPFMEENALISAFKDLSTDGGIGIFDMPIANTTVYSIPIGGEYRAFMKYFSDKNMFTCGMTNNDDVIKFFNKDWRVGFSNFFAEIYKWKISHEGIVNGK